ncbi:ALG6 alpha-1,3-glucosyltransferase garnysstan [Arctopsyche grandis]|uniref:ALG6 alpha-1,3-glucosyltransferase garnysstan n=1 Tax=Arctopsyche grandis TaxID=121162 RepID=UPI00406D810A
MKKPVKVMKSPDMIGLPKCFLGSGILVAVLLRWCVALYPYSGQNKPPMFGDYEAQRHWQEITLHIPIKQWYHNTTQNDLQYWGLDYPPLTAYHSLAMGHIAEIVDPESVVLFASRGYESDYHKLFMRWTVFFSDIYFYIPAMVGFYFVNHKLKIRELKARGISTVVRNVFFLPDVAGCMALIFPGLILIDYGHFQYNCVSLGLFVWATTFILLDKFVLASVFFVAAVNYKQMELYHSIPFFLYLLRQCIPNSHRSYRQALVQFAKISVTVVVTFGVIWLPFLSNFQSVSQVLTRLFPLARGVFEDKVANFWCAINTFIKLKNICDNAMMAKVCVITTLLAVLPSSLDLFFRPNVNKFVLSLINSSLSFFLFSFQVHEKSILLCAVPVLLHLPLDPVPSFWFLTTCTFSMLPLLLKDGLILGYFSLSIIYFTCFSMILFIIDKNICFLNVFNITRVNNILKGTNNEYNGGRRRI